MKRELLRPAVHAGALGFVFLEPLLGRWGMAGTAAAVTLLNLLVLPRTAFGKSLRREGEPLVNGQVTYPLAVAAAYALFGSITAGVAWTVMALGDPAASLVGLARPWKARVPWNRRKSVPGVIAFLLVAEISLLVVFAMSSAPAGSERPLSYYLLFSIVIAAVAALVESIPLPIDDNLPVVLAVGSTIWACARLAA